MKIHGLDLDNSPLISQDKSLRYAENIAIGEGNQSYVNEDGFALKLDLNKSLKNIFNTTQEVTIIGTIPTNIGVVLFAIYGDYHCIIYIKTDTVDDTGYHTIDRIIYSDGTNSNLNFNSSRPIHGDYIYNYKNELVITFTEGISEEANETRIINLNDPDGCGEPITTNNDCKIYVVINTSMFNLIPDLEYPTLNIEVQEGGNIKTGAYQIAIAYKLKDGTYTNYSILSVPVIVCGNYGEDYKPNSDINRNLKISFVKPDVSFEFYKLAIVHITDTTQLVYETEDIYLKSNNEYIVSNLTTYSLITLDDIFIKNISYIREQTLVNYNNRLIRGNVQTLDITTLNEDLKKFTENNLNVGFESIKASEIINTSSKYFKENESYVLYAGYFDYKGDLINIYHIPNKTDKTNIPTLYNGLDFTLQHTSVQPDETDILTEDEMPSVYFTGYDGDEKLKGVIRSMKWNVDSNEYLNLTSSVIDTNVNNILKSTQTSDNKKITIDVLNIENKTNNTCHINIDLEYRLQPWIKPNENAQFDPTNEFSSKYKYIITLYDLSDIEKPKSLKQLSIATNVDFRFTLFNLNWEGYIENDNLKLGIVSELITEDIKDVYYNFTLDGIKSSITYNNPYSPCYNFKVNIKNNSQIPKYVKSIAYFYIEHNIYNSRILSQALCIPDTNIINFAANQKFEGQFEGANALRFYPFEYLYNKISKIKANVEYKYNLGALVGESGTKEYFNSKPNPEDPNGDWITETETIEGIHFTGFDEAYLDKTYAVFKTTENDELNTNEFEKHGVKILDRDILNLNKLNHPIVDEILLEYVSNDNTSQQNIAGDSYYRTKDITITNYPPTAKSEYPYNPTIVELINPSSKLYSNLQNQKLQIASPIISITNKNSVYLTGDTFLSYLTLRITTPAESFRYGDSEHKDLDSNNTVYRWILTFPIESRYNLIARYSDNIIDKPYFLHNASLQKYVELIGTSYKVDNYINTEVGKGYNPIYNENGIENFIYFGEIPGVSNHPHRIIRSLVQNTESTTLNWRIFKTDDYKDLPFNRGGIISLKTDNKNLYIQQKYGLHILQQRDQLNNNESGDSYLGTSDLFNMEPKEVIYSPSGYIGCENQFDTSVNVNGYVVIDVIHKKIFMVSGDKPLEISNLKTKEFFDKFLSNDDNTKRVINYSEDKNILYITQSNSDIEKTMSFSPLHKAWVSFHTYIPDLGFVNRNGLFWGKNGKLYSPTLNNNKGIYFDNKSKPSIIQFILNENTIFNKLLKTIVWKDQVSYKHDDYIQHFFKETINHLMVHNFNQCSSKLDVGFNDTKQWWDGSKGTNKINLWRFNKLFDLVLRDSNNEPYNNFMINPITPNTSKLKIDYKWYEINRFICQFIYLTMWCDNIQPNHEWEIIDVNPEWQLDNRNDQTYNYQDSNSKQS